MVKMPSFTRLKCLALLLTGGGFFMGGCVAPPKTVTSTPELAVSHGYPVKVNPEETDSVTFARVLIQIPPGTPMGYMNISGMKGREIPYNGSGLEEGSPTLVRAALAELRSAGYRVLGGENLLFSQDESAKARYNVGASVKRIYIVAHGSFFWDMAGPLPLECRTEVEWQVFDTRTKTVVFTLVTPGYAQGLTRIDNAILDSFRSAFQGALARQDFADAFKKNKAVPNSALAMSELTIPLSAPGERQLPDDMKKAMDAVVTIRSGNVHGSGFLFTPDGYILTAAHVVSGLETVVVRLASGLELEANVLRVNTARDSALLKVAGARFPFIALSTAKTPDQGAEVYVIGTPLMEELDRSVSKGVVSGLRKLEGYEVIQTDASVNSGSSGGPLIDKHARAVGIVSSKIAGAGLEGIGFAVPVSNVPADLKLVFGAAK